MTKHLICPLCIEALTEVTYESSNVVNCKPCLACAERLDYGVVALQLTVERYHALKVLRTDARHPEYVERGDINRLCAISEGCILGDGHSAEHRIAPWAAVTR